MNVIFNTQIFRMDMVINTFYGQSGRSGLTDMSWLFLSVIDSAGAGGCWVGGLQPPDPENLGLRLVALLWEDRITW